MKITIIGGGSYAWTPRLVTDMLQTPGLDKAEYVLLDLDRRASDLCKAYLDEFCRREGISARIVSTNNQTTALDGADYVIITISTGGLKAMAHDIAIPEKFGVYHTVGDTCGPGGWSRTIRNFDVFLNFANAFNKLCPKAAILNYTNPMITLTDVLARVCKGPVIGLCHGLFENLEFIKHFYKLDSEDEIAVKYAGLNHFFWITEAKAREIDVLADLKKRMKTGGFTSLRRVKHMDPHGYGSTYREVATELFNETGAMPYLGDRHTCEWFPRFIASRENMKKFRIERTSIKERFARRDRHEKNIKRLIKGGKWEKPGRSRETAADIIQAHSQGKVFIDVGNTPNIGQVANLPLGAVVETAVRIDRNGFHPIAFGPLPRAVYGNVAPWSRVLTMNVDALFAGDKHLALEALRLDPICSNLTKDQVDDLGDRLLGAHKAFITAL